MRRPESRKVSYKEFLCLDLSKELLSSSLLYSVLCNFERSYVTLNSKHEQGSDGPFRLVTSTVALLPLTLCLVFYCIKIQCF